MDVAAVGVEQRLKRGKASLRMKRAGGASREMRGGRHAGKTAVTA